MSAKKIGPLHDYVAKQKTAISQALSFNQIPVEIKLPVTVSIRMTCQELNRDVILWYFKLTLSDLEL